VCLKECSHQRVDECKPLVLGPIVVSTFFAWSMTLQKQMDVYLPKLERDLVPTLKR